jgi:hypothetical protein
VLQVSPGATQFVMAGEGRPSTSVLRAAGKDVDGGAKPHRHQDKAWRG